MNKIVLLIIILLSFVHVQAQTSSETILRQLHEQVDAEQRRIDLFDKAADSRVNLKSDELTEKASEVYLLLVDKIQLNLDQDIHENDLTKAKQLRKLVDLIKGVTEENYRRYNGFFEIFDAIYQIQMANDAAVLETILNNHTKEILKVVPFFENKPIAKSFLMNAANEVPNLVMQAFKEFEYQSYAKEVLDLAINNDPDYVKNYLSSYSPIYYHVKAGQTPFLETIKNIQNTLGSASKAYVLSHEIAAQKLTLAEADKIAQNETLFMAYLIELRTQKKVKGYYSIDRELEQLALGKVRLINELHDEKDSAKRFKCAYNLDAKTIYALLVYTEDEIFTSTFLGLFQRLMARVGKESTSAFLFENGYVRYRRFLKMCAGYGVLPQFLKGMTPLEKSLLLQKLTDGIATDVDNVRQCAAVADIYASLTDRSSKKTLVESIHHQIKQSQTNSKSLLLLAELLQAEYDTSRLAWLVPYKILTSKHLFKSGINVQQHFFYNDEDGIASFNSFIQTFNQPEWQISYAKHHVKISSLKGKKIEIYANKPQSEYDGQDAITEIFTKSGHWPDIVVHRGHSFYVETSLSSVTPATSLVILGSCGGYQNVFNALGYSPNAFIISTRQVGTKLVNDQLIYTLNEWIRTGKEINWPLYWTYLDKKFKAEKAVYAKFDEYISPSENLGAIFLRRYNFLY